MKKKALVLIILVLTVICPRNVAAMNVSTVDELKSCVANDTNCVLQSDLKSTERYGTNIKKVGSDAGKEKVPGHPFSSCNLTIDLNGHELRDVTLTVDYCNFNLKDSKKTGRIVRLNTNVITITNSKFVIDGINAEAIYDFFIVGSCKEESIIKNSNIELQGQSGPAYEDQEPLSSQAVLNVGASNVRLINNNFSIGSYDNAYALEIKEADIVVESGTYTGCSGGARTDDGTLTVKGGNLGDRNSENGIVINNTYRYVDRLDIDIQGGTIYGYGNGIYSNSAHNIKISGGIIKGGNTGLQLNNHSANVGNNNGKIELTGGKYIAEAASPKDYMETGKAIAIDSQITYKQNYVAIDESIPEGYSLYPKVPYYETEDGGHKRQYTLANEVEILSQREIDIREGRIPPEDDKKEEKEETPSKENSTIKEDVYLDSNGNQVVKVKDTLSSRSLLFEGLGFLVVLAGIAIIVKETNQKELIKVEETIQADEPIKDSEII